MKLQLIDGYVTDNSDGVYHSDNSGGMDNLSHCDTLLYVMMNKGQIN